MDAQGFLSTIYYSLDTVRASVADYMSGRQADEGFAFMPLDACPADAWGRISKELTIVDVVSLAGTCKSMVQAFESAHLSYGGSVAAIRLAGADAVTPDAVVSILTRISGEWTIEHALVRVGFYDGDARERLT